MTIQVRCFALRKISSEMMWAAVNKKARRQSQDQSAQGLADFLMVPEGIDDAADPPSV